MRASHCLTANPYQAWVVVARKGGELITVKVKLVCVILSVVILFARHRKEYSMIALAEMTALYRAYSPGHHKEYSMISLAEVTVLYRTYFLIRNFFSLSICYQNFCLTTLNLVLFPARKMRSYIVHAINLNRME